MRDLSLRPAADSELHRGLYLQPSALADARPDSTAARDFWIVKHGLKATGMPAWGRSMDDDTIWGMVAFLRGLPGRDEGEYLAVVAASSGHSHGGVDDPMHPEVRQDHPGTVQVPDDAGAEIPVLDEEENVELAVFRLTSGGRCR